MGLNCKVLLKSNLTKLYLKAPDKIICSLNKIKFSTIVNILGIDLFLIRDVYPSQLFRTTNFLLTNLKEMFYTKSVCDMGCGMGVLGQYALKYGAKKVVQGDINPSAIKNAELNKKKYRYKNEKLKIYQSDCFDNIPKQIFDVIVFNIPFHSEQHKCNNNIEYAFYDPFFKSTEKFLKQLKLYSNFATEIFIAFSNKGDTKSLEGLFERYNYQWIIWKKINENKKYDNRLYLLKLK